MTNQKFTLLLLAASLLLATVVNAQYAPENPSVSIGGAAVVGRSDNHNWQYYQFTVPPYVAENMALLISVQSPGVHEELTTSTGGATDNLGVAIRKGAKPEYFQSDYSTSFAKYENVDGPSTTAYLMVAPGKLKAGDDWWVGVVHGDTKSVSYKISMSALPVVNLTVGKESDVATLHPDTWAFFRFENPNNATHNLTFTVKPQEKPEAMLGMYVAHQRFPSVMDHDFTVQDADKTDQALVTNVTYTDAKTGHYIVGVYNNNDADVHIKAQADSAVVSNNGGVDPLVIVLISVTGFVALVGAFAGFRYYKNPERKANAAPGAADEYGLLDDGAAL